MGNDVSRTINRAKTLANGASAVRLRLTTQPTGSGTLCGFHTYVGADDMWVSCREAWVRSEPAL